MAEQGVAIVTSGAVRDLPSGDTVAGLSRSLFSWNSDVTNATGSEETLYSNTLPANTFITNKGWIEYKYWGTFGATVHDINLYVKFGSTLYVFKSDEIDVMNIGNSRHWKIEGSISRVSNTALLAEGQISCNGLSPSVDWFRYRELTGLDLAANSYAMALRCAAEASGDVTVKGAWARYNPGI